LERFDKKIIAEISKLLSTVNNVALIPHVNADGDAVGASVGLCRVLNNAGKQAKVVSPSDYPGFLKWIDGTEEVLVYEKTPNECIKTLQNADLIFYIDFNDIKRIGDLEEHMHKISAKKVLIDHHPHPKEFADYILSDTNASSTSELVYDFVEELGLVEFLDKEVAEALFTGIITDTGSFSYNVSRPRVYEVVGKLISLGADKDKIHAEIYYNFSVHRMRLLGYCLDKKMVVIPELHTAFISLTAKELEEYDFQMGDAEGFVNYPLSIKGIVFTALFMEREDIVKISFRSKGDFPTNKFSSKYFNGGGHINASGGSSDASMECTLDNFCNKLSEFKDELEIEARKLIL
jgi:phosphoesterase RecJ-like protein